jgi:hypothetical protein
MTLDSRIMKMVNDAKVKIQDRTAHDSVGSLVDDLADLGFAKATKTDLQRIVIRAANRERFIG